MQIKSWLSSRTNWTLLLKNHKNLSLGLVISFRSIVQLLYNVWPNVLHIYFSSFSTIFSSKKFRIHSFRIHYRAAKLLALLLSKKDWTLVLSLFQTNSDHVLKFVNCIVHQILHPITKLLIRCTNLMELLSFETNLEFDYFQYKRIDSS